jgi:hypothetical protein
MNGSSTVVGGALFSAQAVGELNLKVGNSVQPRGRSSSGRLRSPLVIC